jgi:hypothetical protein
MAITYTTEYPRATILPVDGTLTNVVKSVYCICRGVDENGNYESIGEDIILESPIESQFVSFDQLTKEIIDSWVVQTSQYAELQNFIQRKISEKIRETVVVELPF